MAFLTEDAVRLASGFAGMRQLAEQELRRSAAVPDGDRFDVFLSHSFADAVLILGVRALLESQGLRVYVDWIDDSALERASVGPETAAILRIRMRNSASLIFATSDNSPKSKWMPWELGYFDGFKPDRIAILPLLGMGESSFRGQEYLTLYPLIEDVSSLGAPARLGIMITEAGSRRAMAINDFVVEGAFVST